MCPARTSSGRTRPGRIGSPAASAEVQPSGRSRLEVRSNTAPEAAFQPRPLRRASYSSYSLQVAGRDEHVPVAAGLHRRVQRHRVRTRVALVGVGGEGDRYLVLTRRHLNVGDSVGRVGAEVRVQRRARPDRGDPGVGVRTERQLVDGLAPRVGPREQRAAGDRRDGTGRRCDQQRRGHDHDRDAGENTRTHARTSPGRGNSGPQVCPRPAHAGKRGLQPSISATRESRHTLRELPPPTSRRRRAVVRSDVCGARCHPARCSHRRRS